jgi:hypothetical protein
MVQRFVNRLNKPIIYIILCALVFFLVLIPDFTKAPIGPNAFKNHANGNQLIDTILNYSPQEAYRLIGSYGANGRAYYVAQSLSLDFIIPVSFMLLIVLLVNQIYSRTIFKKHISKLMLIPFIGLVCDYAENICVISMIARYPGKPHFLTSLSNIFTLSKGLFCTLGITEVFIGLVILVYTNLSKKQFEDGKTKPTE